MKRKLIQFIPLGILVLQMIYCIYYTSTTDVVFTIKHQAALIALCICLILFFVWPRISSYATLAMLLAGVANAISFTPMTLSWVPFGLIPLQLFSFGVFIVWIFCNATKIWEYLRREEA